MKPRLTIILTLYNVAPQYVEECLTSLYSQTFSGFQILVIDDYSSVDYSWIDNCPSCIYIRNGRNLGLCQSVNKALKLVNTEYCVRLGSDDVFAPELLEEEVKFLDCNKSYVAVCCDLQKFGESETLIKRPKRWTKTIVNNESQIVPTYHGFGYAGGMMFRTSVLEDCRIKENYPCCEDFDFHLQLLEHGHIQSLPEALYFYRSHRSNYCKNFGRNTKLKILTEILKEHELFYV